MEVAQPLLPVPRLGALVINSFCTTVTLLQYLRCVPNACDSVTVLEELCKRDFTDIFPYLLSLHATHWHKDVLKQLLRKRLFDLSLPALKALQVHIPKLSALTMDDTTGTLQPFIGPLSSMVTSQWDTQDWYYQILHAKQMEGKLLFNTISLSLLSRVTLCFVFFLFFLAGDWALIDISMLFSVGSMHPLTYIIRWRHNYATWGLCFPYSNYITGNAHRRFRQWCPYFRQLGYNEDIFCIYGNKSYYF